MMRYSGSVPDPKLGVERRVETMRYSATSQTNRRFRSWLVMVGAAITLLGVVVSDATPALAGDGAPLALDVRTAGDSSVTRIVMEFDKPVDMTHRLLAKPARLVLDFPKIDYGFDTSQPFDSGFLERFRFGDMGENHSRLIFEAGRPFKVKDISKRADAKTGGESVVIDLEATTSEKFEAALERSVEAATVVNSSQKEDRLGVRKHGRNRPFTVVIDPGHGGIDEGAEGTKGTREKDVTLAFAEALRDALERYSGARVFLTRDSDVFISLGDRSGFSRQHQADLFISIHADYLRYHDVRGATVYTISEKASDAVAAAVAKNENLADSIAGVEGEEKPDGVSDILIDLARRETLGFSVQFARLVIEDIKGYARLINNAHRHAGFKVLKAPDVPSILLELGYLSNPKDEALMNDPNWRKGLASRIADAVEKFAALSSRDLAAAPSND